MNAPEQSTSRRARRIRGVLIGAAAGLAAAALWASLGPSLRPAPTPAGLAPRSGLVGRPAPPFALARLSGGGTLSLRDLRGRPVVLNFWASWCAPCRQETPLLVGAFKTYGPRGVAFVGVDSEDAPGDARRFIAEFHVGYPVVEAPDDRLLRAYGVVGLPTTVFVGPDGTVRGVQVGGFVGRDAARTLAARLDRLLGAAR